MLRAEISTLPVCGVFYKATVMSVLLFGSETWSITQGTLKRLDGFHHSAAWQMASMQPTHNDDGDWTNLYNAQALKQVGLYSISHYTLGLDGRPSLTTLSIGPILSLVKME